MTNYLRILKELLKMQKSPPRKDLDTLIASYQNGQHDIARNLALAITQKFPEHSLSWKVLGAIFGQAGNMDDSLLAIQKAVEIDPKDANSYSNLSVTLRILGRFLEAEESCRQAIILKPDFAEAHSNLGVILSFLGNLEQAEVSCRQAIILKPSFAEGHENLANTLNALGRLDLAEASHRQAISLKPGYAIAHSNLGGTLKDLGRMLEAEASCRQAIALKPNLADAHSYLGSTLSDLGRLEEAEASYRKAIELKPDFAAAFWNLSIAQDFLNNLEQAILQLEQLLIIDENKLGLRAAVNLAIFRFLDNDFEASKKNLLASSIIQEKLTSEFKNERIYHNYLLKLINWHESRILDNPDKLSDKRLYVIGESHSLVSHGLCVQNTHGNFLCNTLLIMGCMQWHLGSTNRNKFKIKFERVMHSIQTRSDVLISIGEIDCRLDEGIIKHNNKYPEKNRFDLIIMTVTNYLNYIYKVNSSCKHNITIQGVPCPSIDTKNISKDNVKELIDLIRDFNRVLKKKSIEMGFGFLDVYALTDRGDGFSNLIWHLDSYHLTPECMFEAWRRHFYTS
jgi:Flp pilus assembly protein TadD